MKNHLVLFFVLIISLGLVSTQSRQNSKTKLLIVVIDNTGKDVQGADVIIYSNAEDYEAKTNKLVKGKTDKKGRFQFKGLEEKSYFIEVRKDHLTNQTESAETGLLSEDKINKILVVIK